MKRLRILMVSNKCPPDFDGGYELRAFQIAQALRARGHALDFVTSRYRPTYLGVRQDPEWVHRIFRYSGPSKVSGLARKIDRITQFIKGTTVAAENAPALDAFLDGREYDIAYCFGLVRIGFATTAPLTRRGIPILWHAGDAHLVDRFVDWPKKIPGYDLALRLFAGAWWAREKAVDFANIAVVSEFLRRRFEGCGLPIRRLRVISRGIDFPLADGPGRERDTPPTFLMASRLDPQKGIHHAIAALGQLRQRRPELEWRLVIAGQPMTPGYLAELRQQAAQAGIGERIEFPGRLPHAEVLARMRRATAFLFCSTYGEPFSSTIIESLACGTPLVGSDDGSILEVIEPEKSGLVYEKEKPAQLSAHLERLLDDPALRERLALAGLHTIATRYTIDRILELTESVFGEVIASNPRQPAVPDRMSVLIVSEPGVDGVLTNVANLVRFLLRQGHAVHLAYSDQRGSPALTTLVEEVRRAGGQTLNLRVGNGPHPRDLPAFFRLARLASKVRPTVIHSHSSKAGILARALRLTGVPARQFYSPHAYYGLARPDSAKVRFFNTIERLFGRIGTTINVSTDESAFAQRRLRVPDGRRQVISNATDLESFQPATAAIREAARRKLGLPMDAVILGTMGRLSFQKDPQTLYRAAAPLLRAHPGLLLLHVGSGELDDECRMLAAQLGLEHRIHRIEYLTPPHTFYQAVDAVILTSRYEGLPIVAQEALACACPLILTEAPGMADLVSLPLSHRWTGRAEDVESITAAIAAWLEDRAAGRPCNHRAVAEQNYRPERCLGAVLAAYRATSAPTP